MRNKLKFSLTTLIVFLLNITIVHAALMDPVTSKLRYIFFNLGTTAAFSVWLKFAFFVIIFAALHGAAMRVPALGQGSMKRAVAVIAFVIGLTTAIFVPYKLLLYIFKIYHAILVILFAMLPAIVGFIINQRLLGGENKNDRMHRILRGIIYILITIFIFGLIGNIQKNSSPETKMYEDLTEPMMWGGIVALVAGLFNLGSALGGDKLFDAAKEKLTGKKEEEKGHENGEHAEGGHPPATPAERIDAIRAFGANVGELDRTLTQATPILQQLVPLLQNLEQINAQIRQATQGGNPPPQNLLIQRQQLITQGNPLAQQVLPLIQQAQQRIAAGQNLMNRILGEHAAYLEVPEQMRTMFENTLVQFIIRQNRTCDAYTITHNFI